MAKKNNRIPLVILALICGSLLLAMYVSLSTLALGIWGETVTGTVDSYYSRLDDTDGGANRSRTISKGYYFMLEGQEYRGYVIYASDEAWPRLDEGETRPDRIRYLPFFPRTHRPEDLTDFDKMGVAGLLYHVLAPPASLFLLLLVLRRGKQKKKPEKGKKNVSPPAKPRPEKVAGGYCPDCGNRLKEAAAFCVHCGAKVEKQPSGICSVCRADIPEDADFCIQCGAPGSGALGN